MKQLIVTADDFGLCPSINNAVVKAWQEGILTGASLMVTGEAAAEAVELARENPGLQVGLHLTLVQGRATAGRSGFPSLTDEEGNFPHDPVLAGMRMFFLRPLHKALEREIEGQIRAFLATGLPLSHVDGHLNIHMHPTVFAILCRLMARYGISTCRLSRERLGRELQLAPRRLVGKLADAFIFGRLAERCQPELERRGIGYANEVKGLLNSGRMTEPYLLGVLERLQEGITEIYCHPGTHPEPLLAERMPGYCHQEELAALISPRVREKIAALGLVLRNYRGDEKKR
jgi:hopanoid biosynthesis associated protein HpnK